MKYGLFHIVVTLFTFLASVAANENGIIEDLSLPDLVKINSIAELQNKWKIIGDTIYDEGRIVLTPKPIISSNIEKEFVKGSIWSAKTINNLQEFTIESTIRSLGNFGITNAGISIFLISDDNNLGNVENYGGPLRFKGFQLLLDNDIKLGPVFRFYLNDGSKDIDLNNDYIGAYIHEFQDSNVPSTIKFAYKNKWLKIIVDNKLLFETKEIDLTPILNSNVKFGLAALSPKNIANFEQFEVLRLKTYNSVTQEMLKETVETLFAKHVNGKVDGTSNSNTNSNFRQQEQKLRQELAASKADSNNKESLSNINKQLELILNNMKSGSDQSSLQKQMFTLTKKFDQISQNFAVLIKATEELNAKYDDLSEMVKRQSEILSSYDVRMGSFDKVLQNQLENSEKVDTKLSTIHSLYMDSSGNDKTESNSNDSDPFSKLKSIIYMVLIPIIVLLIVVALLVYKLRSDIKHSKVL